MSLLFTWDNIIIKFKAQTSNDIGELLFYESQIISFEADNCVIQIDSLSYQILKDKNGMYYNLITKLIREHFDDNVEVTFVSGNSKEYSPDVVGIPTQNYADTKLSSMHTFENYYYSYDNRSTIEACRQVIDEVKNDITPLTFNPLFIYGSSGIGKTHIANALGNEIYNTTKNKRILFKSAIEFLNEYTDLFKGSLKTEQLDEFKDFYYNLDVLIIDDIQMLQSKNQSLNEFFSIFENLRLNNKTIIITSDQSPKQLDFEERLLTRFLSGLVIQMNFPDSDTKTQIFKSHAAKNNLDIEESAIQVLIESSQNVRELLGYINSINLELITLGNNSNNTYTKEQAILQVRKATGNNIKFTKEDLIRTVCDYFNVEEKEIKAKSRKQIYVVPRNFCIYFLKERLNMTFVQISKEFNMSDHTNCVKIINDFDKFKDKHKEAYEYLAQKLNNM